MLKNYKELKVWQKSYQLCLEIYKATKTFPKNEGELAGIGIDLFGLLKLNRKQRLILGWELWHSAIAH